MRNWAKRIVFSTPFLRDAWCRLRARQLASSYAARRDHYAREMGRRGLVYREAESVTAARDRIRKRGYEIKPRPAGDIHTFALVPRFSWHESLFPDLRELGPLSVFDYMSLGYDWWEFFRARSAKRRREMNARALAAFREAHARRPVDWIFTYAMGFEVRSEFLQALIDEAGVPIVNMCFDDKQGWEGRVLEGQRTGQVDIASSFDLSWTSARVALDWYLAEGARPVYMPEGFDASLFRPMEGERDIPVSFIGASYGFRPSVVRYLRRHGVPLQVFGDGWKTRSLSTQDQVSVINRSRVNVGMGGILHSEELTNVKGRDFEIPGTGGGVYVTSFNPDLAQHFDVGREILCYRNRDEMVELILEALKRPEESREMARRARERCLREHRWLHRYRRLLEMLGVLAGGPAAASTERSGAASGRPS
ncbi:MAG TPA: glycosyltransferase [Gemmatimonadales bacterium]|nr:glycosyltransferase [Gemmatimonadales bacterium]